MEQLLHVLVQGVHVSVDTLLIYPYGHDGTHSLYIYNKYVLLLHLVHVLPEPAHYLHTDQHSTH